MTKLLFPLIWLLSTSIVFTQEIKGKVDYVVTFKSFDKEKLDKMDGSTRVLLQNSAPVRASLTFSGIEANYELNEGVGNDSRKGTNLSRILAGNHDLYYHNRDTGKTWRQTATTGKTFLVEYPPMVWKILRETKKVGDYKCYKAVVKEQGNKETIAWFTPEISAGFGPLHYQGLPGLIMELQTSMGSFTAILISFNPENLGVKKPIEGERVTSEQYLDVLKGVVPAF